MDGQITQNGVTGAQTAVNSKILAKRHRPTGGWTDGRSGVLNKMNASKRQILIGSKDTSRFALR